MNREIDGWISGRWVDTIYILSAPPKTHVLEAWFPESIWKASKAFKGGNCVTVCLQWNYGTLGSFLLCGPKVTTFALALVPYLSSGLEARGLSVLNWNL